MAGAAVLYIASNPGSTPEGVRLALQNAGWQDGDYEYFTDDPDVYPYYEPLLKADTL